MAFIDEARKQDGWKTALGEDGAWIRYDRVDFATGKWKTVRARTMSSRGGTIEVRLDHADGPPLASIAVIAGTGWAENQIDVQAQAAGVHNLFVSLKRAGPVDVDWVRFECVAVGYSISRLTEKTPGGFTGG